MIAQLQIADLGVIASATLPLGPGFTAITGETGAGKTMVVTALGLLMGARSDALAVRAGAQQARVSGIIAQPPPQLVDLVAELGGTVEEQELVLNRIVTAEGRSRAVVGGASTPVGALGEVAKHLFAVHGQSEQLRLRSGAQQRDTLDSFGGAELASTLADYRAVHQRRQHIAAELAELSRAGAERAAAAERWQRELAEIAEVDPVAAEELAVAARIGVLERVEELRLACQNAHEALRSESAEPFVRDAAGLLATAAGELERVAAIDERLAAAAATLSELAVQTADVARDIADFADDLEFDGPHELEQAHARLAALQTLFRSYGANSQEVLDYAARAAENLAAVSGDSDKIAHLQAELALSAEREQALAQQLHELRELAAAQLGRAVSVELQALALNQAQFVVQIAQLPACGSHGYDEVSFLLSPHRGAAPKPLAKTASGGELSRVMLALEVVLAASKPVPTFVFDEVDAGVGGAAAIEVGRRLQRLSRTAQVIVVTHLAQVAAFANNHLRIVKDATGEFTESSCQQLRGQERLAEMARLLSGLSDSPSALAHAAELLELSAD